MALFSLFKKKDDPTQNQSSYFNNFLSSNSITSPKLQVSSPLQTTQDIKNKLGLTSGTSKIQGSGYTSNYAGTKENFQPVTPKVTTQTTQSSVPSYISGYEDLAKQKEALLAQQKTSGEDYLNKYYTAKNAANQANIDALNRNLSSAKSSFDEGLAAQTALTANKKQNAEDVWGEDQRALAQTRAESEARNRNKFAALNTVGSYGAGSYGQAQENVESDFNRSTQQGIRQKESDLLDLDIALQNYELEARGKLDTLDLEVTQAINAIMSDQATSDIEKENAIKQLGFDYQDAVLSVQEGLQSVYQQYYDTLASTDSLSQEFMQTGVPQTQADYKYYIENYKDVYKELGSGQSEATQGVLTLVDELLNANTKGITAFPNLLGLLPGSSDQLLRNKYNQLKSMLSLENRQQLKGSGAISDFEAKVLEKAASALGTNLSDTDFKKVLREMQADLMNVPRESVQRPSLSSFEG